MTARPPRQSQCSASFFVTAACSVWLLACTATNDQLFDTDLGPLVPAPRGSAGGSSAAPVDVVSDAPAELTPPGEPDPGSSNAGSAGASGTARPARPARTPVGADAGAASGADAGVAPSIPSAGDGSCGDQCAHNGGLCSRGTCFFDCRATGSCTSKQVICPSGVPCDVTCGDRACTQNVICSRDSTCNIRCQGERSCAAELICEGRCHVECSGPSSCPGGTGGAVQLLELSCTGSQSCGSTVQCEGQDCRVACSGQQSCARVKIFGAVNTLACTGAGSCGTDVSCNGARCRAQCAESACANDVSCQAVSCQVEELENGDD